MLEFESLLQVFYADHSTKAATRARIGEIRAWAEERTAENIAFARLYRDTQGSFPQRLASIVLIGKFLTDFADMVAAWADWADEAVTAWPSRGRPEPRLGRHRGDRSPFRPNQTSPGVRLASGRI